MAEAAVAVRDLAAHAAVRDGAALAVVAGGAGEEALAQVAHVHALQVEEEARCAQQAAVGGRADGAAPRAREQRPPRRQTSPGPVGEDRRRALPRPHSERDRVEEQQQGDGRHQQPPHREEDGGGEDDDVV